MFEGLEPRWQGAEAKLFVSPFAGEDAIWKVRIPKAYRHPDLERRLTSRRILQAAKAGVAVPNLLFADPERGMLVMQYINGPKVKEVIDVGVVEIEKIAFYIGHLVSQLHSLGIVHGDLTTSNILCAADKFYLIDFGLSYVCNQVEDKAVDLYVLERAISSTHPKCATELFSLILKHYADKSGKASAPILAKLAEVQLRGRKRSMVG